MKPETPTAEIKASEDITVKVKNLQASPEFNVLMKEYKAYLNTITRETMFDKEGNYIQALADYHAKIKEYTKSDNYAERNISLFILSWT